MLSSVALTGGDYEAVVLPEDQELAGFVPLLSIAYAPVYVTRGTDRVSGISSEPERLSQFLTFSTEGMVCRPDLL